MGPQTEFILVSLAVLILGQEIHGRIDDRIVGGRNASEGELPYQVSLRRSYSDEHFCGGSVIGGRYILTAAHCMFYIWGGVLPPALVSVFAGQTALAPNAKTIFRNATVLHIHDNFNMDTFEDDIAIVEVDHPFPIDTPNIAMAALRQNEIKPGSWCTVSGWGVQKFNSVKVSDILMAANISVIDFETCEKKYEKDDVELTDGMMCAGVPDGSKDACQGDSGGPLFCGGRLTGIVSTGKGCADPNFPGIYTDISKYIPWIDNILYKYSPIF